MTSFLSFTMPARVRRFYRKRILILLWWILIPAISPLVSRADTPAPESHPGCVILLHGLGRTAASMDNMTQTLAAAGFKTINLDYSSRNFPIEKLAKDTIPQGIRYCREQKTSVVHFVTHSMGGILVRYYLTRHPIENLGRVVMLSPPNQGSEAADILKDNTLYRWYNGPAGQQLGTGPDGFVAGLGPVDYPVGVITGDKHAIFDAWLADKIPGDDDGKVSVERAKVEGMTDFLVLPFNHPFIMEKKVVMDQTIHFLRHGKFKGMPEK